MVLLWRHLIFFFSSQQFAVDPRNDISHRTYVYVLVSRQDPIPAPALAPTPTPDAAGPSGFTPAPKRFDCVEVYQQDTGVRVFRMTFHSSLTFTNIRLNGSEFNRTLLLLTGACVCLNQQYYLTF